MTDTRLDVERPVGYVISSVEPRHFAAGANRQIDDVVQLLLDALNAASEHAARLGTLDTGTRRAAAALVDASVAVQHAVTAAGRALTDRDRSVAVPVAGLSLATVAGPRAQAAPAP